jgi:hypothetical protein
MTTPLSKDCYLVGSTVTQWSQSLQSERSGCSRPIEGQVGVSRLKAKVNLGLSLSFTKNMPCSLLAACQFR